MKSDGQGNSALIRHNYLGENCCQFRFLFQKGSSVCFLQGWDCSRRTKVNIGQKSLVWRTLLMQTNTSDSLPFPGLIEGSILQLPMTLSRVISLVIVN